MRMIAHYQAETYRSRDSVGHLLKRAHAMCFDRFEPIFEAHGLTSGQFGVLLSLRDGIASNLRDLSAYLHYDSGALSRLIDQLNRRGWIDRQPRIGDRRGIELSLTETGYAIVQSVIPEVVTQFNAMLQPFTREEVQEFVRLLRKLNED